MAIKSITTNVPLSHSSGAAQISDPNLNTIIGTAVAVAGAGLLAGLAPSTITGIAAVAAVTNCALNQASSNA